MPYLYRTNESQVDQGNPGHVELELRDLMQLCNTKVRLAGLLPGLRQVASEISALSSQFQIVTSGIAEF